MHRTTQLPAFALLVALLQLGCTQRAQVIVEVSADQAVQDHRDFAHLHLYVRTAGTITNDTPIAQDQTIPRPMRWPFRIVLTPSGDNFFSTPSERYEVIVGAHRAHPGDPPAQSLVNGSIVTTRARSGYVRGETRVLQLRLEAGCIGFVCDAGTTCRSAVCEAVQQIDPGTLPTLSTYQTDAGPADAYLPPGTDAFGLDAWRPDTGMDAFVEPGVDAFVEPPDAFVPPGTDANAPDAPDAYAPPPDAGGGPLRVINEPIALPAPAGMEAQWGSSVAVSDDGERIAVAGALAVRVFRRSGMDWLVEREIELAGLPMAGGSSLPAVVALNRGGSVLAIGRPGGASSGRAWALDSLSVRSLAGEPTFGLGIALSGDGSHVYVSRIGGFDDITRATGASFPVTLADFGCTLAASHTADQIAIGPCFSSPVGGIAVFAGPGWTLTPGVTSIDSGSVSLAFGGTDLAVGATVTVRGGSSVWVGPVPYTGLEERVGPSSVGFGTSVGLSGNGHFVVGSIDENAFYLDGTDMAARTTGPPGSLAFGAFIAIDRAASTIVVGAPGFGGAGTTAHVYRTAPL